MQQSFRIIQKELEFLSRKGSFIMNAIMKRHFLEYFSQLYLYGEFIVDLINPYLNICFQLVSKEVYKT